MKRSDILKQQIMFYENNYDRLSPTDLEELHKLKEQLSKSKKGKSAKIKGASYERTIAKIFKKYLDIDLVRTPLSGGFAKQSDKAEEFRGDITSLDDTITFKLHIEAKCQKTWSVPTWIRQSKSDCPKGKIYTVVFHEHGTSNNYILLPYVSFKELLGKNRIAIKKKLPTKKIVEEWKPIQDYPDYFVSNLGQVKSIKNNTERILKQGLGDTGYYNVALCKEGKPKTFRVHQLVASHYLKEGYNSVVNHIDGNKLNNVVTNLEYVTSSNNNLHAYSEGLKPKGEDFYNAKVTDKQVLDIRVKLQQGILQKDLQKEYNVSSTTISRISSNLDYRNPYNLFVLCKNQKTWKLKDWLKQSQEDCPKNKVPCVVFHQNQENKDGKRTNDSQDYITLKLEDFLTLVDSRKVIHKITHK